MLKLYFKGSNRFLRRDFKRLYSSSTAWNVLFFGSDQFSLYSLKLLCSYYQELQLINKLDVVTKITKQANDVQKFATNQNLTLYNWPDVPIERKYDVGVVVSFGYLIPQCIIEQFPYGILNVHGSLLPKWRGAAPIIYSLAKGDRETGVTVMRIKPNKFDTGDILLQESHPVGKDTMMPELHKSLGELGAQALVKTLKDLPNYIQFSKPQSNDHATYAPKVLPDFAVIKWDSMNSQQVYNLYRALYGFLLPTTEWHKVQVKLSGIKVNDEVGDIEDQKPGCVSYSKMTKRLNVICADKTIISVDSVSVLGKKVMSAADFHNGFLSKVPVNLRYFV
ncbi:unnamed protein product [Phyllotreta striolata]|uniref:Methionyl-tRNA formyltransferase, mitochondrial n=1 Tax=Phyllotreta striolata TaxID=444603 RepID=A0A9N9TD82_PHYSR|nr:unnamed protein product [Phyllotreta striolata]